jgi:hypothetical protein
MPVLGCGFLPKQTRNSWRGAAFKRLKVPLILHLLNHQ